jgi:hypothetical protein
MMKVVFQFIILGLVWSVISVGVIGYFYVHDVAAKIRVYFWVETACLLDLLMLAGLSQELARTPVNRVRLGFFGASKVFALGWVGLTLWKFKESSPLPLILGATTMMIIPLAGAIILTKRKK